jgi:outer membrane protein assembly factor BamB
VFRGAVISVLVSAVAATAADWPHVRGPSYDAISRETGLADRWPEAGPPILWAHELGPGYSSFVIAEGRAFTLFQSNGGMYLIALNLDTGEPIWKVRVDDPWHRGGMYPGPFASPTYHDGPVFFATPTGLVGCVRSTDGEGVWSVNIKTKFGTRGTEFGYASTPAVEKGRVYLPVGGRDAAMVALSTTDGGTLWASGVDPASYCPALPITLDGRRLVVGFLQNSLVLFDARTGEHLWRERYSSHYDEHAAWPLFDGRHLLIASPFKVGSQLYRLDSTPIGVAPKRVWANNQLSNDVCSSILVNGSVYGFDIQQLQASPQRASRGAFKCLDFLTGKVRWETEEVGQSSLLLADRKLLIWTETGELILAKPNPDRYEEVSRAKVLGGGLSWSAPALSGKKLIVRDHKQAVCLYLGSLSDLDPARATYSLSASDHGFDWSRLVPKEPDFPNDAPDIADITRWFIWCVGLIASAAVVTFTLFKLQPRFNPRLVFVGLVIALGAIGTTTIGHFLDTFVLTWPVSLYFLFRGVLSLGLDRTVRGWRHHLFARLALLFFIVCCYGYFRLCMAVGLAMGWSYLMGFVPALPFTVLARRTTNRKVRWLAEGMGFVVYFWVSALIPGWKAARGE